MTTQVKDHVDQYVTALAEDGSNRIPMATTDATEVIRSQLTENTGRHFLDSGSHYGRHWEDNQDNPPWEQPAWVVNDGFVTHNVYDYMLRTLYRDSTAVALEIGLYTYAYHGPGQNDSWLSCMEGYAEYLQEPSLAMDGLMETGLPRELAEQAAYAVDVGSDPLFTFNTYNQEMHGLSQCLQGTSFGGPYAEYTMIQVHGGCDIRGGYTAPRVYSAECPLPHELWVHCAECGWDEAESCLYGTDELLYLNPADGFELEDALDEADYDYYDEAFDYVLEKAQDREDVDGAVIHLCGDGELGLVNFS